MDRRILPTGTRLLTGVLVVASVAALTACEPEEVEVAPPEIAEIEREPAEVELDGDIDPAEVEFEEAYPMTADDVGDRMLVSGTVVGTPGPAGFFVDAGGGRILFVESTVAVQAGQRVEARGPLQSAEVSVFEGWERELLGDLEPDWETIRLYYVDATTVTPLGA